jgi:adenylosuccinate synthase
MTRLCRGLGLIRLTAMLLAHQRDCAAGTAHAKPVWKVLNEARRAGKRILFEGAGALLTRFRTYLMSPRPTSLRGRRRRTGLGPGPRFCAGIVKAYTTWRRRRPVPGGTVADADGERLGERGFNSGQPLGRAPLRLVRCGSGVAFRATSGVSGIALTKLDVLDGFKTLKICWL